MIACRTTSVIVTRNVGLSCDEVEAVTSFTTCLMLDQAPCMYMIADRSREKLRWVRIQPSVDE